MVKFRSCLILVTAIGVAANAYAADPLNFDGGLGSTQVDQYTGTIGGGWSTPWTASSGASGSPVVTGANPLSTGTGDYLFADLEGTNRNVIRQYGNTPEFDVNSAHSISWDWRMDDPYVPTTSNDRINFFANPTLRNTSTASSNTWIIGVAPSTMGHSNWYFYDRNDENTNGLTAANSVDTGMTFQSGVTYSFTLDIDPMAKQYSATVSNGVDSFTFDDMDFRNPTLGSSYLHFGLKSSSATKAGAFSLDSVHITGGSPPNNELPLGDGFKGIWYRNQNLGAPHFHKYSGGLGTYTQQLRPLAYYSEEANKTFFTWGGTNEINSDLYHMISYYDHATGEVARPRQVLAKGTTDAHDNPQIMLDDDGHIYIFSPSHGTARQSFISRSTDPYDISSFENVLTLPNNNNFSYSQPLYIEGQGFMFMHTLYESNGRTLKFNRSSDGVNWDYDWDSRPTLVDIDGGQYQISEAHGNKVGFGFNWHPNEVVNNRTNLYYMQSTDLGDTWTTVDGTPLTTPVTAVNNAALVHDYQAEGKRVYLKDITYDNQGNPILMYLTATQWQPGPQESEEDRTWHIAHYKEGEWQIRDIFTSDHNYDYGQLYLEEDGAWRIIAPTTPGAQAWGTGGEMVMWESFDQGETWTAVKQLTHDSEYNHAYARRPVNAHPDFYSFWADGNPHEESESRLYYTNKDGSAVWQLPWDMESDFATPELAFHPLALSLPGDFNEDGVVDSIDYAVWREGLDSVYTANDFLTWQANYGRTLADLSSESGGVPEPGSLAMLVSLVCGLSLRKKRLAEGAWAWA